MNLDSVLTELVRGWGAEQLKSKNILNQNGANFVYLHGMDMANKLGVDPELGHIMPYPPKVQIVNGGKPSLAKKALPFILAGAAAVGGWMLKPDAPAPTPTPDEPAATGEVGFDVR